MENSIVRDDDVSEHQAVKVMYSLICVARGFGCVVIISGCFAYYFALKVPYCDS